MPEGGLEIIAWTPSRYLTLNSPLGREHYTHLTCTSIPYSIQALPPLLLTTRKMPFVTNPLGMDPLATTTPAPSSEYSPGSGTWYNVAPKQPRPSAPSVQPLGGDPSGVPRLTPYSVKYEKIWATVLSSLAVTSLLAPFALAGRCPSFWGTSTSTRSVSLTASEVTRFYGIFMSRPIPSYVDTSEPWSL